MTDDLSIDEIKALLIAKSQEVATDCIPDAKLRKREVTGHVQGKLSVCVSGPKAGAVMFFAGQGPGGKPNAGSLLDLIQLSMNLSRFGDAVKYAKEVYLGITKREFTPEEKRHFAKRKAEAEEAARKREADAARYAERRGNEATELWRRGVPIEGTAAEAYLLDRIGGWVPKDGWPKTLRYVSDCPTTDDIVGRYGSKAAPALICAVTGNDRSVHAIWRIFVNENGKKAFGDLSKMGLGNANGHSVRLCAPKAKILLTEGMETAFGVWAMRDQDAPVWACLSTAGLMSFDPPEGVSEIVIYGDSDRPLNRHGHEQVPPGQRAAEIACERFREMGLRASYQLPPATTLKKADWLDVFLTMRRSDHELC